MTKHRVLQTALAAGIALIVVVIVGCAGDATGSGAPVETNEVTMPRSYRFAPETIQVTAGTTVTFRNDDNFTHSVKLRDGSEPDHRVSPGESVQITFAQPGTFNYECSLHPRDMRGTVIVTGAPPAADYGG
ncbi:MAG: cupredoxin domain-containing protein [Dehalococcoidia bacterium]